MSIVTPWSAKVKSRVSYLVPGAGRLSVVSYNWSALPPVPGVSTKRSSPALP